MYFIFILKYCLIFASAAPVEISGDGVMKGTFSLKINWGNRFEGELMFHAAELVEGFVCTLNFNMPVSALDVSDGCCCCVDGDGR